MITIYGIPNCDSVKKARQWFEKRCQQTSAFEFYDFRKKGITVEQIQQWCEALGKDKILNRKSTSWRKLSDEQQQQCESVTGASMVMQENVTLIKRPVVVSYSTVIAGFDVESYERHFKTLFK